MPIVVELVVASGLVKAALVAHSAEGFETLLALAQQVGSVVGSTVVLEVGYSLALGPLVLVREFLLVGDWLEQEAAKPILA